MVSPDQSTIPLQVTSTAPPCHSTAASEQTQKSSSTLPDVRVFLAGATASSTRLSLQGRKERLENFRKRHSACVESVRQKMAEIEPQKCVSSGTMKAIAEQAKSEVEAKHAAAVEAAEVSEARARAAEDAKATLEAESKEAIQAAEARVKLAEETMEQMMTECTKAALAAEAAVDRAQSAEEATANAEAKSIEAARLLAEAEARAQAAEEAMAKAEAKCIQVVDAAEAQMRVAEESQAKLKAECLESIQMAEAADARARKFEEAIENTLASASKKCHSVQFAEEPETCTQVVDDAFVNVVRSISRPSNRKGLLCCMRWMRGAVARRSKE